MARKSGSSLALLPVRRTGSSPRRTTMSDEKEKNTGKEKDGEKGKKERCKHCITYEAPDKAALALPIVLWTGAAAILMVLKFLTKTKTDAEFASFGFTACVMASLVVTVIFYIKPFVIGKYIYIAYHNGTIHCHAFPFIYVPEKNSFYLTPDDPSDRIHGAMDDSDRVTAPILQMKVGGWRKMSKLIFHHLANGHRNLEIVKTKGKMLTIGDRIRSKESTLIQMTPEKFLPLLEDFNVIDDIFNSAKESNGLKKQLAKADGEHLRAEKGMRIAIGRADFLWKKIVEAIAHVKNWQGSQKSKVGQATKEFLEIVHYAISRGEECPEWGNPQELNEEAKRLLNLCEQTEKMAPAEKQKIIRQVEQELKLELDAYRFQPSLKQEASHGLEQQ